MKRVLVAGIHHESNSFNPIIAGENDFIVVHGSDIFNRLRDNDSVSGIIKTLQTIGYEVIPAVFARAVPNGEVDRAFYERIKAVILDLAQKAHEEKPLDAITLSLHGSMRIKEIGDAEGDLLEAIAEKFPNIPVLCSLDMHTTMTMKMHKHCNGFVGYKCAPHTDCTETGAHAAKMTEFVLENNKKPKTAWVKVPIIIAGEKSATSTEPMIELMKTLRAIERKPGILAASYLMGFPWADNPDSSIAVYVVAEEDERLAEDEAIALADLLWSKRNLFKFHTETYPVEEAIDVAFKGISDGLLPIYLSDAGDNPTAGASSDCTQILELLINDKRALSLKHPVIYGGIYDPAATLACKGKIGEILTLSIGAKFDTVTSKPLNVTGKVKAYVDGWGGILFPKGDLALFHVNGIDIVLSQTHVGYVTPEIFIDLGVNPKDVELVVCKLGYLTEHHEAVAQRSIMALSTGNTNADLCSIPYALINRPLFPLDQDFSYDAKKSIIKKEMTAMTLEVCVDGYESLLTAQSAGADRIELCSALNLGGLTPSYGLMKQAISHHSLEVFVMIRPRSGDFLYTAFELETMKNDIALVKEMGFHGIVIGMLKEDGSLDLEKLREVTEFAKPLQVVLHRAFDQAKRPEKDIPALIEMGICRILTSGQKDKALDGADYIRSIQDLYGDQITIMPGSGVSSANVLALYENTGCSHYHLSGRIAVQSGMKDLDDTFIEKADFDKIKEVRILLDAIPKE